MSTGRRANPPLPPIGTYISVALVGVAFVFILYLFYTGMFKVREYEQSVVLRFGKIHNTVGPGLHVKLPWIDQAIVVDTSEQSIRLPGGSSEAEFGARTASDRVTQDESLILTGDLYAAVVEWNVIWRIAEPEQFVLSFQDVETLQQTIVAIARSTMHRAVGDYSAEEVLTGQREAIKMAAWNDMSVALDHLQCGVIITDLQMQRVTPPQRVRASFDSVNASIQQRDQSVNEAMRERNMLVPMAEARKDQLIREAEGYAARLKAETEGELSALRAKYESYKLAPDITRQRMYLETMEKVLTNSGPKTILDGDMSNLLPLLNLGAETNSQP